MNKQLISGTVIRIVLFGSIVSIISFSHLACKSSKSELKGEISIIKTKDGIDPSDSLAIHKNRDVEVFRLEFDDTTHIFKDGIYSIHYYQNENDSLKSHKAWIVSKEKFDKAAYTWLSDTSISVRLYSSESGKESIHKLFGFGRSSGMFDNQDENKSAR